MHLPPQSTPRAHIGFRCGALRRRKELPKVQQAQLDPLATQAPRVQRAQQAILDPQDGLVPQATPDQPVTLDLLVRLDPPVRLDLRDGLVPQERLGQQETLVPQEMLDQLDRPVTLGKEG